MSANGDEGAAWAPANGWAPRHRPKAPKPSRASAQEDEIMASAAGCTWTLDGAPKMREPDRVGRALTQRWRQREEEAKRELDERLARIAAQRNRAS